jgi:Helix-turn-helix domain
MGNGVGRPEKPLQGGGPLVEFALQLRALRTETGEESYRKMAKGVEVSESAMANAARGEQFPSWRTVRAFALACGADPAEWRQKWVTLEQELRGGSREQPADADLDDSAGDPAPPARRARPRRRALTAGVAVALVLAVAVYVLVGHFTGRHDDGGPAANPGAPGGTAVRFSFETGLPPWGRFWNGQNVATSITNVAAYDGQHALRLATAPDSGRKPAVGTTSENGRLAGIRAGSIVTFHVRYGGQGTGGFAPFVYDSKNQPVWSTTPALQLPQAGTAGWITYQWKVPPVTPTAIGIQIANAGDDDFIFDLDGVSW